MNKKIPAELNTKINQQVLAFLEKYSAHPDAVEQLEKAIATLGDVQMYCPDFSQCKYVCCSTNNVIFAFVMGQNTIGFRLDEVFKKRAVETGNSECPQAGKDWAQFTLFRDDWPEIDLKFWALNSYVYARQSETRS